MKFESSEEYTQLGWEVVANTESLQHLRDDDVRIGFMRSEKKKKSGGKVVNGECFKVQELYKEFCPYDFLIVLYEPNIEHMNEDQIKILLEHELMHVGVDGSGDDVRYSIVPHDYDDFKDITRKYGVDWAAQEG